MPARQNSTRMDEQRIRALQRARSRGSTSILLSLEGRSDVDQRRLADAIDDAHRRVVQEVPVDDAEVIMGNLRKIRAEALTPGASSVALFASSEMTDVMHLDVELASRVVVDDTFATRDLMLALHLQPTVHVVTLGEHRTRCFVGAGAHLEEVRNDQFPMIGTTSITDDDESGAGVRWRSVQEYARVLERRLRTTLADDGTPLVLIGSSRRVAAVSARPWLQRRPTRNVNRQMEKATLEELAEQVEPIAASLVASRRTWALEAAREAVGSHRAAVGIRAVWEAATRGHVQTLVVERGYHVAARLHPDGVTFARTEQVTEPGVVDDLVDELIEQVLATRGGVVIVEDGDLAHADRVTAVLRHRTPNE